jgi:hypothetical protein
LPAAVAAVELQIAVFLVVVLVVLAAAVMAVTDTGRDPEIRAHRAVLVLQDLVVAVAAVHIQIMVLVMARLVVLV